MISFSNPKLREMASGEKCIELTEAGNWEMFPSFAKKFASQINAEIIYKGSAVDMHIWEIQYADAILNLVYDDYPNGISIEPKTGHTKEAIIQLYELISKQSVPSGL
jgi:hypothetical protein